MLKRATANNPNVIPGVQRWPQRHWEQLGWRNWNNLQRATQNGCSPPFGFTARRKWHQRPFWLQILEPEPQRLVTLPPCGLMHKELVSQKYRNGTVSHPCTSLQHQNQKTPTKPSCCGTFWDSMTEFGMLFQWWRDSNDNMATIRSLWKRKWLN